MAAAFKNEKCSKSSLAFSFIQSQPLFLGYEVTLMGLIFQALTLFHPLEDISSPQISSHFSNGSAIALDNGLNTADWIPSSSKECRK